MNPIDNTDRLVLRAEIGVLDVQLSDLMAIRTRLGCDIGMLEKRMEQVRTLIDRKKGRLNGNIGLKTADAQSPALGAQACGEPQTVSAMCAGHNPMAHPEQVGKSGQPQPLLDAQPSQKASDCSCGASDLVALRESFRTLQLTPDLIFNRIREDLELGLETEARSHLNFLERLL